MKRSLFLFLLISSLGFPLFLTPTEAEALTPVFSVIETSSIERTWDDVSLLYPDQYLNNSMVIAEVDNILTAAPDLVDVNIIGQSYEGRDILSIRITNEGATHQKAKTLLVAHHHGREMVTVNHAIYFMQWLVNSYGEDVQLTEYVDSQEIYVIPTMNPDALDYIFNNSDYWLRKNLRPYDDDGDGMFDEDTYDDANGDGHITQYEVWEKGSGGRNTYLYAYYEGIDDDGDGHFNEDWVGHTDLNRNYDANWGIEPSASLDSMSQAFAGTAPFSEPETQAFRDFAQEHRFGMAYSLHTGINATYFVTGFSGNWIEGPLYSQMWNDYEEILPDGFNYYLDYSAKQNAEARPAILSGGWDEYMYHELDCLAPITFEIYHNASAESEELYYLHEENSTHFIMAFDGIYEYFSPDTDSIENLWLELIPAYEYLLEQTPRISVSFSGGSVSEASVSATMMTTCLSPRIETIAEIEIQLEDGTLLDSAEPVDADTTYNAPITLEFSSLDANESIRIRAGNEFSGYLHFEISFGETGFIDPVLIGGVTIAIVAVVIVLVFLMKRR